MYFDRRILIADDDTEVRLGAAELLSGMGLEVLQAGTGTEALDIFRRDSLDLALLDVHMPGRDGVEVFQTLRVEDPGLPCILWSGDATDAVAQFLIRSGAAAFLRKPVQPRLLKDEIQRVLTSRPDGSDPTAGPTAEA